MGGAQGRGGAQGYGRGSRKRRGFIKKLSMLHTRNNKTINREYLFCLEMEGLFMGPASLMVKVLFIGLTSCCSVSVLLLLMEVKEEESSSFIGTSFRGVREETERSKSKGDV